MATQDGQFGSGLASGTSVPSEMALEGSENGQTGSANSKLTKEDLELFHHDLLRGFEPSQSLKSSLQRLRTFLDEANTPLTLTKILQPMKREIRRCQRELDSVGADFQSQVDQSKSMIEDGKFPEALSVMIHGHFIMRPLIKHLEKLGQSLHEVPTKASKAKCKGDLVSINYDDEITSYRASVTVWRTHRLIPSWSVAGPQPSPYHSNAPQSELYSNIFQFSATVISSFLLRAFGSIDGGDCFCFSFSVCTQSSIALILPGYMVSHIPGATIEIIRRRGRAYGYDRSSQDSVPPLELVSKA